MTGDSHLVELFLPLASNDGVAFGRELFDHVRDELLRTFGGVTLFSRSPADGLWAGGDEVASHDRMIMVEVMTDHLDGAWWADYRRELERRFGQEEVLIRAHQVRRL